jgi:scyllo-inositol 2-dehydrogenase (NADP+)
VTSLHLLIDDDASPLAHALHLAPWSSGAGISLSEEGAQAAVLCVTRPSTWEDVRRRASETRIPTLVVGPGLGDARGFSPLHEVRVRPRGLGRADDVVVRDRVLDLSAVDGDVLATANIAFTDLPLLRWDPTQCLGALGVGYEPDTWHDPEFLRLVHRVLHRMTRDVQQQAIRVGLLGYGAIGHEHAAAIGATDGLDLAMVCDLSPDRLSTAAAFTPGVTTTSDPAVLRDAQDVDLVVVSTPPNTHGQWAIDLLGAGKHVVLEKPMALTTEQCDAAIEAAARADRTLVVYQNRRFDPDFRAIAGAIDAGELGEVFHLEAFVGAYQHPCNYWHSDADVSGGALFDWGSHIVDQILQLMPGDVEYVTARNHKRMWHDVTNADHARMTLHYADGREATFIYSDLAAALKPRWYLAGTKGGLIGDWRRERVIARSPIGTLAEDVLAPADAPPELWLHGPDGRVTAVPGSPPPAGEFHRQLADYLREGLPMTVTAEQSRRVVAMLEAAEESARRGGAPVAPR